MLETVICPELVPPNYKPCQQIAEVLRRPTLESTSGPVEMIVARCVNRHIIFCPVAGFEAVSAPDETATA